MLLAQKSSLIVIAYVVEERMQALLLSLGVSVLVWSGMVRWKPYRDLDHPSRIVQIAVITLQLLMVLQASGTATPRAMKALHALWVLLYTSLFLFLLVSAAVSPLFPSMCSAISSLVTV